MACIKGNCSECGNLTWSPTDIQVPGVPLLCVGSTDYTTGEHLSSACEIAWARKSADLPVMDLKSRRCLLCDGDFASEGKHNRLCDHCKEVYIHE